jgi:hypothetical protein
MNPLKRWWRRLFPRSVDIPRRQWEEALSLSPVLRRLNAGERRRLRELAGRFLHDKSIVGVQGLELTEGMKIFVAAQACLLILNLDPDDFDGWREVIVYPDTFVATHEQQDAAGVVHLVRRALNGEAWDRGPVILSWDDIQPNPWAFEQGRNVILHEFAHKLDMRNGAANGMPPLHAGMSRPEWTETLTAAYDDLNTRLALAMPTPIDPYAAESPGEFFAVLTEVFFEQPVILHDVYPRVYALFREFYRQDPIA